MGNGHSGKSSFGKNLSAFGNPIHLQGKAKIAASKFDLDEIHVLHKTWQDMSDRSNGKGRRVAFPIVGLLNLKLIIYVYIYVYIYICIYICMYI
jgi:hypothetical protein